MGFNRSVVAITYPNLCLFEFAIAAELFGLERPELDVDWYDFSTVAVDEAPSPTLGGLSITAASTDLSDIEGAGIIIIPGWRWRDGQPQELVDAILAGHANGARVVSICSGVFLLAATGLLDGAAATTHWSYVDDLQARYPKIDVRPNVLYVDNGDTLTSAGSAAGIDLGLHLIRQDFGPEVANLVARRMVMPAHRDGGQAQFIQRPVTVEPAASIAPTLDWARENLGRDLTVRALADHAHVSERTFLRRFGDATGTTPHRWLTQNRIQLACELLEGSALSVDEIARRSGFGSAANLRHHFGREMHTSPSRYRQVFQPAGGLVRT